MRWTAKSLSPMKARPWLRLLWRPAGGPSVGLEKKKHPRGMYCGIGLCHECMMVINGVPNTKACQTLAEPGCHVKTQHGLQER